MTNEERRQQKMMLNNQLQSFSNPMQNLFSVMEQIVCNMGVKEYAEVLQALDDAEKMMRKAIDKAQELTYRWD